MSTSVISTSSLRAFGSNISNYSLEKDGVLLCLPSNISGSNVNVLLTIGFFAYEKEGSITSFNWGTLFSVSLESRKKETAIVFLRNERKETYTVVWSNLESATKAYKIIKDNATALTPRKPEFIKDRRVDLDVPYSSKPDIYLLASIGKKDSSWEYFSKILCSRPTTFCTSQFKTYYGIVSQVMQAIDVTRSINTFVIDTDISPYIEKIINFFVSTIAIRKVVFNIYRTKFTTPIDKKAVFNSIIYKK